MSKTLSLLLLILFDCFFVGCGCEPLHSTPDRPKQVRGWREYKENGITYVGEFLLNKGESNENGKLGVEFVDAYPSRKCSDPWAEQPEPPKARVKFYRVSDKHVLLEAVS